MSARCLLDRVDGVLRIKDRTKRNDKSCMHATVRTGSYSRARLRRRAGNSIGRLVGNAAVRTRSRK